MTYSIVRGQGLEKINKNDIDSPWKYALIQVNFGHNGFREKGLSKFRIVSESLSSGMGGGGVIVTEA